MEGSGLLLQCKSLQLLFAKGPRTIRIWLYKKRWSINTSTKNTAAKIERITFDEILHENLNMMQIKVKTIQENETAH